MSKDGEGASGASGQETTRRREPVGVPATLVAGDFELQEEVGRGGQGIVYKAFQRSTRRMVALKLLGAEAHDGEGRHRFAREVILAASLRHPGIVAVHASGHERGQPWCAFEYVRGMHLADFVRARGLDIRGIVAIMAEVADAMAHAHQRGVIHRDIKSSNILVDGEGRVRICDFGVARTLVRVRDEHGRATTRTGDFIGTWTHAAPEQLAGDADRVDTRTDVFALGVVLYQLLTGSLPHAMDRGPEAAVRSVCDVVPVRPSRANPRIGRSLDAIVMKALEKDQARRYATAAAMRDDLNRWLEGAPVDARRDSAAHVIFRTLGRHRTVAALSALVLLAVVAGLLATMLLNARLRTERDRARLESAKAREVGQLLRQALGPIAGESDTSSVALIAALDEAAHRIDARHDIDPAVRASLQGALGEAFLSAGAPDRALRRLRSARRTGIDAAELEDMDLAIAIATADVGPAEADVDRAAEGLLRKCVSDRIESHGPTSPRVAEAELMLARVLAAGSRLSEAAAILRSARARLTPLEAPRLTGLVDLETALVHDAMRVPSEADRHFEMARVQLGIAGISGPTETRLLMLRARSAGSAERHEAARALATEALAVARARLERGHPLIDEALELARSADAGTEPAAVSRHHTFMSERFDP